MLDFVLMTSNAMAQEGAKAAAKQPSLFDSLLLPMGGFMMIMYFLILRPQSKKAKEHTNMLKELKSGDEVITSGGIVGRIKSIADSFVTIDVSSQTSLKILKTHVTGLTKKEPAKAAK